MNREFVSQGDLLNFFSLEIRINENEQLASDLIDKMSTCIDLAAAGQSQVTLTQCLHQFKEHEELSKEDSWSCPKCKNNVQAIKQLELYQTPPFLILSLKRFDQNNNGRKLDEFVDFPLLNLDLSREIRHFQLKQMVDNRKPPLYDLCGIVHHYGNSNGGHYTAACLNSESKLWYEYNDHKVSLVNDPQQLITKNAYILIY